jgi:8-oxo-dGTP diphosphatase
VTEAGVRVPVVAAVIRRDGRYLVCRRPRGKRHGGLWEFPGGKVLEGETRSNAVRRELAEELALEVIALGSVLFSTSDEGAPFVIEFVEAVADGTPALHEHSELGWFTAHELRALPLAPADALFASSIADAKG